MKKLSVILMLILVISPVTAKDNSAVPRFRLEYTSRGSMWPMFIRFTVDRNGRCEYSSRNRRTGTVRRFTDRLTRRALSELKSKLLNDYNFFSLPAYNFRDHSDAMVKDASTRYLTVSISGKTRRIGGYAINFVGTYSPAFNYVWRMVHDLRKKHFGR